MNFSKKTINFKCKNKAEVIEANALKGCFALLHIITRSNEHKKNLCFSCFFNLCIQNINPSQKPMINTLNNLNFNRSNEENNY